MNSASSGWATTTAIRFGPAGAAPCAAASAAPWTASASTAADGSLIGWSRSTASGIGGHSTEREEGRGKREGGVGRTDADRATGILADAGPRFGTSLVRLSPSLLPLPSSL